MYLFVPMNDREPWQHDHPPDEDHFEAIRDEELQVFRLDEESGRFERYDPQQVSEGVEESVNWEDVPFQRKS